MELTLAGAYRAVQHSRKGGMLSCGELLSVARMYRNFTGVKKWYFQYDRNSEILDWTFSSIWENEQLEKAIFDAILGEEVLPETDYNDIKSLFAKKEEIITTDDLLALDKNGDGSIIEELKGLLTDPEFVSKVEFELQRQENIS